MFRKSSTVFMIAALLVLGCFVSPVLADGDGNPNIKKLAAEWWQWICSIPFDINPNVDLTGEFQDNGQSGEVWFLGSTFGWGETFERSCEVPADKAVFFSITAAVFWAPEDGKTPNDLRRLANAAMDGATTLECTVDEVPLEELLDLEDLYELRAQTRPFTISDTLLIDFGYPPLGGRRAVADGYWVYLDDLEEGEHVIHFYMELTSGPFAGAWHDVTYHLTIVDDDDDDDDDDD